jgi:hypothetical protein
MQQCRSCGTAMLPGDLYCGQCGHVVEGTRDITSVRDRPEMGSPTPFTPPPLRSPSNPMLLHGRQSQQVASMGAAGPTQGREADLWPRPDAEEYYPTLLSNNLQTVHRSSPATPIVQNSSSIQSASPFAQPPSHVPSPYASPDTPLPPTIGAWSPHTMVPQTQPGHSHSSISPAAMWPPRPSTSFFQQHLRKLVVIAIASILIISSVVSFLLAQRSTSNSQVILPPAHLEVSPSTLNFGKLPQRVKAVLAVNISNKGEQSLNWTAETSTPWLTVQTRTATIDPGSSPQTNNVMVNTNHLSPGIKTGQLVIHSNGGNLLIAVTLDVIPASSTKQAKLDLSTSSFNLGTLVAGTQTALAVTVANVGTQTLNWKADSGNTWWLGVDKKSSSGTIPPGGQPETINLIVNTTGLTPGSYQATLTITSNGGNQNVPIGLVVNTPPPSPTSPSQPPILKMSPSSLNFGAVAVNTLATQQVIVRNSGGEPLTWKTDTGGTNWVKLDIRAGMLQPATQQVINVTVDTTGLAAGGQSALVTFSSNGGNYSTTLTMTVLPPPPNLCSLASTLHFAQVQQGQMKTAALTFSNCGGQQLQWAAATTGNPPWLVLDGNATSSGVLASQQSGTIKVQVDTSQLQASATPYKATITFSTNEPNGGHEPVAVSVTVLPCWSVAPANLSFTVTAGSAASSQQLTIANCGTVPLTWSAQTDSSSSSWLSVDTTGSVSPGGSAPVNVTLNPASLSAGTDSAIVTVDTSGGSTSVAVSVTVVPTPTPTPIVTPTPTAPPVLSPTPTAVPTP